jgi:integrase
LGDGESLSHRRKPGTIARHIDKLVPKKSKVHRVRHYAALAYTDVPAFMTELRAQESTAARALEFAILTAARTGEVRGAKWDEVDFATKTWTIAAARMKADKEHRIPFAVALSPSSRK